MDDSLIPYQRAKPGCEAVIATATLEVKFFAELAPRILQDARAQVTLEHKAAAAVATEVLTRRGLHDVAQGAFVAAAPVAASAAVLEKAEQARVPGLQRILGGRSSIQVAAGRFSVQTNARRSSVQAAAVAGHFDGGGGSRRGFSNRRNLRLLRRDLRHTGTQEIARSVGFSLGVGRRKIGIGREGGREKAGWQKASYLGKLDFWLGLPVLTSLNGFR